MAVTSPASCVLAPAWSFIPLLAIPPYAGIHPDKIRSSQSDQLPIGADRVIVFCGISFCDDNWFHESNDGYEHSCFETFFNGICVWIWWNGEFGKSTSVHSSKNFYAFLIPSKSSTDSDKEFWDELHKGNSLLINRINKRNARLANDMAVVTT